MTKNEPELNELTNSRIRGKNQIDVGKIHLKYDSKILILLERGRNKLVTDSDVRFWLVDEGGEFVGENPSMVSETLKISLFDALRLFKNKLEEEASYHQRVIDLINKRTASLEKQYGNLNEECEGMRENYTNNLDTEKFQSHIFDCLPCYHWFAIRVKNGTFQHKDTILEEVKTEKQKRKIENRKKLWKEWLEKKKQVAKE